jgi:multiple sugar transport system permease protein
MKSKSREMVAAYLFLTPFLITLLIFFVYAFARAVFYSFTDYDLFNAPTWVWFQNYRNLFQEPNFLRALTNTITFALVVTTLQTVGALIVAAVLNTKVRGITFFRTAYYLPSITSSVVIGLIFLWIFQRRGAINYLITQFLNYLLIIAVFVGILMVLQVIQVFVEKRQGLPATWTDPALLVVSLLLAGAATFFLNLAGFIAPRDLPPIDLVWLQTRNQFPSEPSFLSTPVPLISIMILNLFTTIPTFMLMFLAALQNVPVSHYEAASLDGATPVQQFLYVTVPSVQPVTFLVVTLGLIGTLQMFDQVAIFGNAVPLESVITLAYFVYDRMFPGAQLPEVGFASAAAMFLALLTLAVVLIQRLFIPSEQR